MLCCVRLRTMIRRPFWRLFNGLKPVDGGMVNWTNTILSWQNQIKINHLWMDVAPWCGLDGMELDLWVLASLYRAPCGANNQTVDCGRYAHQMSWLRYSVLFCYTFLATSIYRWQHMVQVLGHLVEVAAWCIGQAPVSAVRCIGPPVYTFQTTTIKCFGLQTYYVHFILFQSYLYVCLIDQSNIENWNWKTDRWQHIVYIIEVAVWCMGHLYQQHGVSSTFKWHYMVQVLVHYD